jgi:hypothetical protein
MFLILYYLINSRRKIVEIKSLLRDNVNDNCKIYFDLNDFERTKNKKLIRCLPFSNFYDKNKFASDVFNLVQVNWR